MNERIRELVEKSYIYDKQNDSSFFNKELFAQLIVRECCDQVRMVDAMEIKKHFGVEE
jgi:hypothetical protein